MVEVEIYGNEHGGEIALRGTNIAKDKQFYTDAGLCIYGKGVYIYNRTNRYWHDSSRGNVVELRNIDGKKIKDAGTKEIEMYDPKYWGDREREGRKVPLKVREFWIKLLNKRR